METLILFETKMTYEFFSERKRFNLQPHRRGLRLLYVEHPGDWCRHYRNGRNQHSVATYPSQISIHLQSWQTLRSGKNIIWISDRDNRPSTRKGNIPIGWQHHNDHRNPGSYVTRRTHHGPNRPWSLEWTHTPRQIQ